MTKPLALLPALLVFALAGRAHAQATAPVPAGAPAPAPGSAPPASPACEPPCRPGFYCAGGECRSLCNPPCAAGEQCTPERLCVPSAAAERQLLRERRSAARAEAEHLEDQLEQEKHRERLAYRRVPRLTLQNGFGLVGLQDARSTESTAPTLVGFALRAGWRQNFNQIIGIHAGVGALLGAAATGRRDGRTDTDDDEMGESGALDLRLDAALLFNPFWRLYLGPVASAGLRSFGKKSVVGAVGEVYDLTANQGLYASAGSEIGFLFLRREQLDVALRIQFEIPTGQPHFFLVAGYHFLLGSL